MDSQPSSSQPVQLSASLESDNSQRLQQLGASNDPTSSYITLNQSQSHDSPNRKVTLSSSMRVFEQKLHKATGLKNTGNSSFKHKNYAQAIKMYSEALNNLEPSQFYGATQDQCSRMAELSSTLLCNIGYCYFNMSEWYKSQVYFSEAIIINPKYIKAIHKRALARFELNKFQQSFEDIKLAFSLDKTNTEVHAAYKKILAKYNEQQKKTKEQMKELSTKIFNKESQKSQSSIQSPKKEHKLEDSAAVSSNNWSWLKVASFAGAAAFIGISIFKSLKK